MNQSMPSVQMVAHAIHCALSISSHDRFATVEQFREALWQVIPANQMATQTPELPMVGPAGEHMGPLVLEPMIPLPIEEKNTGPDVNLVATQTPELPMVGPAGARTGLDAEPDVSIVEVEIPTLIANATIQAEVTPPLSPAFL